MIDVRPVYQGFAPLASCHFQGVANILEAQGLPDALRKICISWGFSWDGESPTLWHGNRWIELANEAHGLALSRRDFASWSEATRVEAELLERGLPFVAEIDSFYVPSEYEGTTHVSHTVTVLAHRDGQVAVLDSMNQPRVVWYPEDRYAEMRTDACVDRHHLYVSEQPPSRLCDATGLLELFGAALNRNWAGDLAVLDDYLAWAEQSEATLDVCRPGAERLYLAALFALLAEHDPALDGMRRHFLSLSKRWYLVHSIAEQAGSVRRSQEERLRRLLRGLRDREAAVADELIALLDRATAVSR
jgi:hypothetical protein